MKFHRRFGSFRNLVLHSGDCLRLLKTIPSDTIALTLTSPPYCIGKEYERGNRLSEFVSLHIKIFREIIRVTKSGGSICWQVGYHVDKSVLTPLDFLIHNICQQYPEVKLRNRIMWTYGHGLHCTSRFSGRHETLLWYTKGDDYTFDLDRVRVRQKYPGKRHFKGVKKGEFSGNPLGKNPSDVWEIPNVKANHVEKTDHPCQFPVALALRLIRCLTDEHDWVLDPFLGSGTTAVAALLERRRFVGAELKAKYFKIVLNRCEEVFSGNSQYRDPEKPLYVPDPNSAVARDPFLANGTVIGEHLPLIGKRTSK